MFLLRSLTGLSDFSMRCIKFFDEMVSGESFRYVGDVNFDHSNPNQTELSHWLTIQHHFKLLDHQI